MDVPKAIVRCQGSQDLEGVSLVAKVQDSRKSHSGGLWNVA